MKILIVDDHEVIVKSTSLYLRTKGFTDIDTLTDSRQVMKAIFKSKPDVILLDLNMPYISGNTLIRQIKQLKLRISIFVISAVDRQDVIKNCKDLGVKDYFIKPINNKRLVDQLKDL